MIIDGILVIIFLIMAYLIANKFNSKFLNYILLPIFGIGFCYFSVNPSYFGNADVSWRAHTRYCMILTYLITAVCILIPSKIMITKKKKIGNETLEKEKRKVRLILWLGGYFVGCIWLYILFVNVLLYILHGLSSIKTETDTEYWKTLIEKDSFIIVIATIYYTYMCKYIKKTIRVIKIHKSIKEQKRKAKRKQEE